MKSKDELDGLPGQIIAAAMELHREFGLRLLERGHDAELAKELRIRGFGSSRQAPVAVAYQREPLDEDAYPIDLLGEDEVVVELKTFLPLHEAQLHPYRRLSDKCFGSLIHFNVILPRDGIERHAINFSL